MKKPGFENAADFRLGVKKLRNRNESNKEERFIRSLVAEIHGDIGQADE